MDGRPESWDNMFMPQKSRQLFSRFLVWVKRHYQRCGWVYLGVACGVLDVGLLVAWGLAPTMELALAPSTIQPEVGQAYHAVPGPFVLQFPYVVPSDETMHPAASRLHLLEDGRLLGPSHSIHQTIREGGHGAFSYWTGRLYFSTSDGTDPRTNGK